MKKIVLILVLLITVISCKNSEKESSNQDTLTETNANFKTYSGEFIYIDDAAVLKGPNFIYGVKLDEMTQELAKRIESVKREEFDMVPVVIRGVVNRRSPDAEEGWEEIITIKEIVSVSTTPSEADIKIEEKKN